MSEPNTDPAQRGAKRRPWGKVPVAESTADPVYVRTAIPRLATITALCIQRDAIRIPP
jgi:hypothetical protein